MCVLISLIFNQCLTTSLASGVSIDPLTFDQCLTTFSASGFLIDHLPLTISLPTSRLRASSLTHSPSTAALPSGAFLRSPGTFLRSPGTFLRSPLRHSLLSSAFLTLLTFGSSHTTIWRLPPLTFDHCLAIKFRPYPAHVRLLF